MIALASRLTIDDELNYLLDKLKGIESIRWLIKIALLKVTLIPMNFLPYSTSEITLCLAVKEINNYYSKIRLETTIDSKDNSLTP